MNTQVYSWVFLSLCIRRIWACCLLSFQYYCLSIKATNCFLLWTEGTKLYLDVVRPSSQTQKKVTQQGQIEIHSVWLLTMEELISSCTCPPMQNSPVQVGPLHDSHRILSRRKLSEKGRWHNYGLTGVVLQGRVWGNHWDTSYNFILNFEVYFPLTEETTQGGMVR